MNYNALHWHCDRVVLRYTKVVFSIDWYHSLLYIGVLNFGANRNCAIVLHALFCAHVRNQPATGRVRAACWSRPQIFILVLFLVSSILYSTRWLAIAAMGADYKIACSSQDCVLAYGKVPSCTQRLFHVPFCFEIFRFRPYSNNSVRLNNTKSLREDDTFNNQTRMSKCSVQK